MREFATVEKCKLCGTRLERDGLVVSTLTEKGCTKIKEAGVKRGKEIDVTPKEKVHEKCRNEFCHPFYINRDNKRKLSADSDGNGATPAKLRSKGTFNFATDCLFCGLDVWSNFKEKSYPVKTLEFQITLLETCKSRGDEWAQTVNARIQTVSDLHAADAVYHQTCSSNFRTSRGIPKKFRPENQESASTTKQIRTYAPEFLDMTQVLEDSSDDQMTVSDLVEKMKELHGEKAYSTVWMKQKLKEYYGESILISELHGKSNVITFRKTAASILHEFYKQNSMDSEDDEQKHQIIRAAAALIRSEVLALECDKSVYVSPKDLSDMDKNLKSVPRSLQDLLSIIFGSNRSDVKKSSIGQAIVQATRPRSFLCPLQLGLGVQVHHLYASRFLVDTLYNLGFSVSYSEVMRFEASAAMQKHNQSYNIQNSDFLQFVADNVDHNTDTLDGKNTFHGMGMIASITPHPKGSFGRGVPRLDAKPDDIAKLCNVDIQYYVSTPSPSKLRFKELLNVPSECIQMKVDILSKLVRPLKAPIAIWSGMMQLVGSGSYPGKSFIDFLPIIDMNPGDPSCVFSTLQFVCKEADKYDRKAVITFDQPLYWKAILIAEEKSMDNIVVRLGGFHTQMSFLGSIGHIMSGSDLKALLEIIYASNSVNQMLSGKAVSRAVRGYMLVDAALALLLHEITFGKLEANKVDDERNEFASKLKYTTECYDKLSCKETNVEQAVSNDTFKDLEKEVEESTTLLRTSRTSQLWLNFMIMVNLLKKFITAERTGNWDLHLAAIKEMIPYFAASGHNLYAKSAHVYLNQMQMLEKNHPAVYAFFKNGHHIVRRSDRYWSGLSTDHVIEQVLMRSIKSTGGLTRGRGMGDSQRATWLLSMPATSAMNVSMQALCGLQYTTSDQHTESSETRMLRDSKDMNLLRDYLRGHNPFNDDERLRSIETGEVADKDVTSDNAEEIGNKILQKMTGSDITEYVFKRKDQVVTMSMKSRDSSKQDRITPIDPQLMFQRLSVAAEDNFHNSPELFKYELSSNPSSMFDDSGFPREATKSSLADSIWGDGKKCSVSDVDVSKYVLDGGSLLHRIPWSAGKTFSQICDAYIAHVQRNYPLNDTTVVFDSYPDEPSTKDITHMRRSKCQVSDVLFTEDMPCRMKKELFLTNKRNKQQFINLLVSKLTEKGITTIQAPDDADIVVAKTAINLSESYKVAVVGEDTDILVLLLHHVDQNSYNITFKLNQRSISLERKQNIGNIQETAKMLGREVCRQLPFLHALTGCDTTSRLFGIGKNQALKKCMASEYFRSQGDIFLSQNASKEAVMKAGEEAITCLYGGLPLEGLQILRWRKFTSKTIASRSKSVLIHTLPPTPDSAKFHSFRTYHQCQVWVHFAADGPLE